MLDHVRERVRRYFDDGDAEAVLEPAALDDATLALAADGGDPVVDHAVGLLYLCRHMARGVPGTTRDARRAAVLLVPLADRVPARVLGQLRQIGTTAREWHDQSFDLFEAERLGEAVELLEDAIAVSEPGSPERLTYLNDLYVVFRAADGDVVELTDLGDQVVEAAGGELADLNPFAAVFGEDLRRRFARTAELPTLVRAVDMLRYATETLPHGDPNEVAVTASLCSALVDRFEATGDLAFLRQALDVGGRARSRLPEHDRNFPALLDTTAGAARTLAGRTGDAALLAEALTLHHRGLALLAPEDPQRPALLTNLVATLMEGPDAQAALAEADRFSDEAVRAASAPQVRVAALTNRSEVLRRRYQVTGDEGTLRRAIEAGEEAHRLGGGTIALSLALSREFDRIGEMAHLERAIALLRTAVAAADNPVLQAHASHLLGAALLRRHTATGDTVALDEAAQECRRAVTLLSEDHPDRVNHLNSLGTVLLKRYDRTGIRPVLTEAVEAFRAVVAATPPTHPHRVGMLRNLSNALGRASESDEAISLLREAVTLARPGSPDESSFRNDLGIALRQRFDHTGDPALLDEAIELLRAAADAAPRTSDARPRRLSNLAFALARRSGRDAEVAAMFQEAALSPLPPTLERVADAREWGRTWARTGAWSRALAGFELAVELLPRVASHGVGRRDQEHGLRQFDGLATDAAACALNAGDSAKAARLLEQGRGILIAQQLDPRADLTMLRSRHPELAATVERLQVDLESWPEAGAGDWLGHAAREADRRHGLTREWDTLITRIRALPGFADFLAASTLDALREQAAEGPIVLINVSHYRSDALILTTAGIDVVPLPDIAPDKVVEHANEFYRALHIAQTPGPDEKRAQRMLARILGWLWDALTAPVLDRLEGADRVWWSPTGVLAFLPLHAAGHHDRPGCSVLDRVISSYTPTVRALRHARARAAVPTKPGLLAVAMPQTPGATPLPHTEREIMQLDAAVRLTGAEATAQRVRAEISRHARVHFACHGITDQREPSAARLLLHDHETDPLTVRSIARLDLTGARLAYLSACQTAYGDPHLSDEAVNITSAFLLAGYPQVIGTLWRVNDRIAGSIARDVYRGLSDGSAAALHAAVRGCREAYPDTPSLWSAHIHAGA
ncbi:CHAT domain-containing protein [Micromonospora sp. NPDC050397]|uniref:CHAT domain-containing protein n=1 Tax=Micromonospora sp. NPDC050397 TaxID=3364279 RepID=UPI00385112AA